MTYPARHIASLLIAAALIASCRGSAPIVPVVLPPPALPSPSIPAQWLATQTAVLAFVNENKATLAESSLTQFSRENPRTPEGDRARWWRTLMRVDARANSGDAAVALAQIDSLLADSVTTEVRAEATLMRRNINAIDSLRRAEVRRRVQATQLATDRLDELKVARDSMAKLNAEISRLKRRLSAN
ncbi:MAG: hypothetical protein H7099_17335 [Gemmatimonadaceae bacterium]|nr:hypothetical protein [Gemmatimonadaceae bacterium]